MSLLETLLRIKGYATPAVLAACSGQKLGDVEAWVADVSAKGYVDVTRIGLRLTATGRDMCDDLTAQERESLSKPEFEALYERFEALNQPFKALVAMWQLRMIDGVETLNDHGDAAYDEKVIAQLGDIHAGIIPVMVQAGEQLERLSRYSIRFELALEHIQKGDNRHFAAPLVDSYHTVWFELHEDLIRLTGRSRAAEALAGRAS